MNYFVRIKNNHAEHRCMPYTYFVADVQTDSNGLHTFEFTDKITEAIQISNEQRKFLHAELKHSGWHTYKFSKMEKRARNAMIQMVQILSDI